MTRGTFPLSPSMTVSSAPALHRLADQCGEILVSDIDAFIHDLLDTLFVKRFLGLIGESLAVGSFVMHEGYFCVLETFGQELARDDALLVVPAANAEHHGHAPLGNLGIGSGRRDHVDAMVGTLILAKWIVVVATLTA